MSTQVSPQPEIIVTPKMYDEHPRPFYRPPPIPPPIHLATLRGVLLIFCVVCREPVISGLDTEEEHCVFEHSQRRVLLNPLKSLCVVNNTKAAQPTRLYQGQWLKPPHSYDFPQFPAVHISHFGVPVVNQIQSNWMKLLRHKKEHIKISKYAKFQQDSLRNI